MSPWTGAELPGSVYWCRATWLHGLVPSYLADEFMRVSEIKALWHRQSALMADLVVPHFQRKTLEGSCISCGSGSNME